jgi:hypothetical protein
VTPQSRRVGAALALLFLALHLPFLPASLEDVDSINFALAIRDFDVPRHQPHPPGVPIYVAATKLVRFVTPSETTALAVTAILAGAASVFALMAFYRRLDPAPIGAEWPILAALLAVTTPLFWFTAARPMNDMPGLAAAVGIQALTLAGARNGSALTASAFLAAFASGLRLQVAWLTVPLIVVVLFRRPAFDWAVASRRILLASMAGALCWVVPLAWLSGGPAAYWRALSNQGMEDLSGVVMLWTTPTPRQFLRALNREFVAPWGEPIIAIVVIVFALAGAARLARAAPGTLWTLVAAFGPYFVLDVLFQETATVRYALPLIVPVAYLTVRGLDMFVRHAGPAPRDRQVSVAWAGRPGLAGAGLVRVVLVAGLTGANLFVAGRTLLAYSGREAPGFRMLDDMRALAGGHGSAGPVLAMHRRLEFDLRRPILWLGDQVPRFDTRLLSPPKREWLELVKYWNSGRRGEMWFLADPLRSDLALLDGPVRQGVYRWSEGASRPASWLLTLLGGTRPKEADWYVVRPPAWYLGEGWELTPETAGVAREAGVGPSRGPVYGWIRRRPEAMTLMVGGRNLTPDAPPTRLRVAIDGWVIDEGLVSPGWFLKMLVVPPGVLTGSGDYATLTVEAVPARGATDTASQGSAGARPTGPAGAGSPAQVVIEQFDAESAGSLVFGYSDGWHLAEYSPETGRQWRWTSERAVILASGVPGRAIRLNLSGEVEAASEARVTIRVAGQVVAARDVGSQFVLEETIPAELLRAPDAQIVLETDQSYVPAERSWRWTDRRRLGLKIFECRLTPVS